MTWFQSIAMFAGGMPSMRDLAAMVHVRQHVGEGFRHARHFQPDVEALGHAQLADDVAQIFALDVDRAGRAHASRQRKPIVVDVGDDDMTRADVAGDRRRHDADRPCAGDQHVLADEVERQRGVRCVAERVEYRAPCRRKYRPES